MKIFLFINIFFATFAYSQPQWEVVNPSPFLEGINDLYFLSENTGIALANNDEIYKTTNGGLNWNRKSKSGVSSLSSIVFINNNTGFAVSENGKILKTTNTGESFFIIQSYNSYYNFKQIVQPAPGKLVIIGVHNQNFWPFKDLILVSVDNGNTWNLQTFQTTNNYYYKFGNIVFKDSQTGFITTQVKNTLFKTTNAGLNWTVINVPQFPEEYFVSIDFVNPQIGYLCSGKKIFKSIDGGISWSFLIEVYGFNYIFNIKMISEQKGIISGNRKILSTTDGWNTIVQDSSFNTEYLSKISLKNESEIFLYGFYNCYKSNNSGLTWNNYIRKLNLNINDMQFLNENTGFITNYYEGTNKVLKTTDGGLNYTAQSYAIAKKIKFLDLNTGYAISGTGFAIFKTHNGGENWFDIDNGTSNDIYEHVDFINSETGFVAGYTWDLPHKGVILITTNGGTNWNKISSTELYPISQITMIDESNLYIISNQKILFTTNQGISWNTNYYTIPNGIRGMDIKFTNVNTGYLFLSNQSYQGYSYLLKTTNSGGLWLNIKDLNDRGEKIQCIGDNIVYVLCKNSLHFSGNAGNTWGEILKFYSHQTNFLSFYSPVAGYVASTSYICLRTTNAPSVGIQSNITEIPSDFILHQNYPNPFNPVTNIKFSLPTTQYIILKIFDITGREIATLVNDQLNAGEYNYQFNADDYRLSSGVYFYQLSVTNSTSIGQGFVQTKRFVLVK